MASSDIKNSILRTLAYRDIFSYALTFYQTYNYLISPVGVNFEEFKEALVELIKEGKIIYSDGFFHLGNVDILELKKRQQASRELFARAKKISTVLGRFPTVLLVCVTGAVAAGNSSENDDIDILVVASKNKLWITRLFVVLTLKVLNLYRKDGKEKGRVCPNIFLDENDLSWSYSRNVYTAHEALLMRPVLDKAELYLEFLGVNGWVRQFFPHAIFDIVSIQYKPFSKPGFLERLAMTLQLWYMRNKKTKEITTDKFIHFKRNDHSERILSEFGDKCKILGISEDNNFLTSLQNQ